MKCVSSPSKCNIKNFYIQSKGNGRKFSLIQRIRRIFTSFKHILFLYFFSYMRYFFVFHFVFALFFLENLYNLNSPQFQSTDGKNNKRSEYCVQSHKVYWPNNWKLKAFINDISHFIAHNHCHLYITWHKHRKHGEFHFH